MPTDASHAFDDSSASAVLSAPRETALADTAPSVLVLADPLVQCDVVPFLQEDLHCEIQTATDRESARLVFRETPPDLVLLDLALGDANGYELLQEIKENPRAANVAVVAISALASGEDGAKALELGADDFVSRHAAEGELRGRVQRLLRLRQSHASRKERRHGSLYEKVTDSLTGLFSHGFLREVLRGQLIHARREAAPLSLVFADADHFKQVNDRYGHTVGDEVLRAIANAVRGAVRRSDIVARYQGAKLALLLPRTGGADAQKLAERLRADIEALKIALPGRRTGEPLRLTISLGTATFPEDATDADSLLQHAEEALYAAKQAGRNSVATFGRNGSSPCARRPSVLLVDDSETSLCQLERYLSAEGYHTLKARDGEEALEIARRALPDVILLDAVLPRISGLEVCRRLKLEKATCLIPVVVVTSLNSRAERLYFVEAGAEDFLSKPVDKVALLTRVRALVRSKRNTDLLEDAEAVIIALARAVEARDCSTGAHVERVAHYAVELGRAIGLSQPQLEGLRRAGFVHDIGKIAVPDAILLKPGKLTPEERRIMERHVDVGYELLQPMRTFAEALPAVRFHHERLDGSGYMLGLRGEQIPVVAQIMAIVDVYDALTTDRVYRAAMPKAEAVGLLHDEAARGLHDPRLVETFVDVLEKSQPPVDARKGCPPEA